MPEARAVRTGGARRPPQSQEWLRRDDASARGATRRRKYNRKYMQGWRKRRRRRDCVDGRTGERKQANRSIPNAPEQDDPVPKYRCWYRCGQPAAEMIERVDPRSWQRVLVPYCGLC